MVFTHGVNPYFDNFNNFGEQELLEDLIIESISIFGMDMFYLPRTLNTFDALLTEDSTSIYNRAIPLTMYIKDVSGFMGDGAVMSQWGAVIHDQVTFTFPKRIWEEEVGSLTSMPRPNEGDIVYFPLNGKCFQIEFVDYKPFFYQLGALPTYDVVCKLFQYSNETFDTGIPEIDQIQVDFSTNIIDWAILDENGQPFGDENGNYLVSEAYGVENAGLVGEQNEIIQKEQTSNNVINFSELDPFADGSY